MSFVLSRICCFGYLDKFLFPALYDSIFFWIVFLLFFFFFWFMNISTFFEERIFQAFPVCWSRFRHEQKAVERPVLKEAWSFFVHRRNSVFVWQWLKRKRRNGDKCVSGWHCNTGCHRNKYLRQMRIPDMEWRVHQTA